MGQRAQELIEAHIEHRLSRSGESWRTTLDDDTEALRQKVATGASPAVALGRLSRLALSAAGYIEWRALRGDTSFIDDIDRLEYYKSLRFALVLTDDAQNMASAICWAIMRGNKRRAQTLVARAAQLLSENREPWAVPKKAGIDMGAFASFAGWLGARWLGAQWAGEVRAPYTPVAAGWQGDVLEGLSAIADHHACNIAADESSGDEFVGMYSLLPVEFGAIATVRESEQLGIPATRHALLDNPAARAFMAARPSGYSPADDPLLALVLERVRTDARIASRIEQIVL